jgi:hypothetical protein
MGWKPLGRGGSPRGPRRFAPWAATCQEDTRERQEATRKYTEDPERLVGSAAVH